MSAEQPGVYRLEILSGFCQPTFCLKSAQILVVRPLLLVSTFRRRQLTLLRVSSRLEQSIGKTKLDLKYLDYVGNIFSNGNE